MSRLGLDASVVDRARRAAAQIADRMDDFIRARTTVAVERTVLRLMG
ncbi:MAG: lysine 5,6-aminomutase subunit alpha TIM-barrel domain-containing protein, partial [Persicimonas sp.]